MASMMVSLTPIEAHCLCALTRIAVFNVIAVVLFYGLIIATFIAIDRGMGTHLDLVLYERGMNGLVEYSAVRAQVLLSSAAPSIALHVAPVYAQSDYHDRRSSLRPSSTMRPWEESSSVCCLFICVSFEEFRPLFFAQLCGLCLRS